MKSFFIFSFLTLLLPVLGSAQSAELLHRISIAQTMSRLDYEQKYDSIIYIGKRLPSRDTVYLYGQEASIAHAYFKRGDTLNGLKFLQKAIELQQYSELGQVKYHYGKFGLEQHAGYQSILSNFNTLSNKHINHFDRQVLERVLEIYYTDQRVRNVWFTKMGDSAAMKCVDAVMLSTDSMNVVAMDNLLKDLGHFPGISEIGIGLLSNFKHILAHWAVRLKQDRLVAALKAATLNGQIPNYYGPFILDKIEYYRKQPLIYGEFGNREDYKNGVYHFRDIRDIDYVDKRRAEFLLPPLYRKSETENCVLPKDYVVDRQKK